jgi:hypothetical protein
MNRPIPTIEVEPAGRTTWRFRCTYCDAYHHHGGPVASDGSLGHRVAHCHDKTSPYMETGYMLRVKQAASQ